MEYILRAEFLIDVINPFTKCKMFKIKYLKYNIDVKLVISYIKKKIKYLIDSQLK